MIDRVKSAIAARITRPTPAAPADRRRAQRRTLGCRCELRVLQRDGTMSAALEARAGNISRSGVAIEIANHPLRPPPALLPGAGLVLRLEGPDVRDVGPHFVLVRHARTTEAGDLIVGAQFAIAPDLPSVGAAMAREPDRRA